MKNLIFVVFVFLVLSCSTLGDRRNGYVITTDGARQEFKNALIWTYQTEIIICTENSDISIPQRQIKEFHILP